MSRREWLWRGSEEAVWQAYRRRGYRLVARNWKCRLGELDLVVAKGELTAFCEVKARTGQAFGGPHESVNATKQRKVRALAEAFIGARGLPAARYRFDVASGLSIHPVVRTCTYSKTPSDTRYAGRGPAQRRVRNVRPGR